VQKFKQEKKARALVRCALREGRNKERKREEGCDMKKERKGGERGDKIFRRRSRSRRERKRSARAELFDRF